MEWKVEERAGDLEILCAREQVAPGKYVEIRILHDIRAGTYTLRLVRLRGFTYGELSLLSSICTKLGLSIDYSPSDRTVFLNPSPLEYVYTSLDKIMSRIREIIEMIKLVVSYVKDIRGSLEIAESILSKGWLVNYDGGRIESVRRTYEVPNMSTWLIVQIYPRDTYYIGKISIRVTCIGKRIDIVRRIVDQLQERGFKITSDMTDLGYAELEQEVYSMGLTDRVVDEVDKLINEVTVT
ncbi:MAG: hypothetical protein GXO23_06150 [Crenarchaeota archaeon]|nr:hypothetical protein [Thermoproteota archaeon]